jgi:SLT domain-containing protein
MPTSLSDLASGPVPKGKPRQWINKALDITNSPESWAAPLYDLMMRESGGDPRAYNDTAVASGEHAQGLFQTIPSTFQAHNKPGLGGINNPVSNAVAAIRYIMGRYGSPFNLPSSGGY